MGAGVAWEAATRGLKVALVERDDFAAGTSGRSTKLIHGGIRYLEAAVFNLDWGMYKLVQEALSEVRARSGSGGDGGSRNERPNPAPKLSQMRFAPT